METIIKDIKKLIGTDKVSLGKVGAAFVISHRRYDPVTGSEVTPVVYALDSKTLLDLKAGAEDLVLNVNFALSEIAKIK